MPTYSIYRMDLGIPVKVKNWTFKGAAWMRSVRTLSAEYHAQFPNERGQLFIAEHIRGRPETSANAKDEGIRCVMDSPALPDSYKSEDLEPVETRLERIARLLSELHTEIHYLEDGRKD